MINRCIMTWHCIQDAGRLLFSFRLRSAAQDSELAQMEVVLYIPE